METHKDTLQARSGCISDLQLDAYWLFGDEGESSVKRHIEQCARCRRRWAEMSDLAATFTSEVFPATVNTVIDKTLSDQQRLPEIKKAIRSRSWGKAALLAASVLLTAGLLLVYAERHQVASQQTEYLGDKGVLGLEVWCRRAERVFRVNKGDTLYAEDMIRFVPRFSDPAPRYVMIVSIDNKGQVSRYFPADSDTSAQIETSGAPLPGSTILDTTDGPERVILITSQKEFHYNDVERALVEKWQKNKDVLAIQTLDLGMDETSLFFYKGRE